MDMAKELKGSRTEANLMTAFAGESQARNRYSYFADKARDEGFDEIAKFFEDTATNEKVHAKVWYKLLNGGSMNDTKQNLRDAIAGERQENSQMYPSFVAVAMEEGFGDIAKLFAEIARIEKKHEEQCKSILDSLENNKGLAFHAPDMTCLECGHDFNIDKNYEKCPVCTASPAFFLRKN
jgi:rubrerythrin